MMTKTHARRRTSAQASPPLRSGEFTVGVRFPTTLYNWRLQVSPTASEELASRVQNRRTLELVMVVLSCGVIVLGVATILLAADATTKIANPVFGVKMVLMALRVVNMVLIRRVVFRGPNVDNAVPVLGKFLAGASLVLWFGATTAGRLMAYLGAVSGLPGVTNKIGG